MTEFPWWFWFLPGGIFAIIFAVPVVGLWKSRRRR